MTSSGGGVISKIEKGSLGEELGLKTGDVVTHINQKLLRDIIDYKLLSDEVEFALSIRKNGSSRILTVRNPNRKPLGIRFESSLFDGLKRCENKCVFCFVDQLPPGLRESLYLKDDDYRLSFLYGNFVTFNNLGWGDVTRIIEYRLSPLYLSLHTANPELRSFMMGSSNPQIFDYLKALSAAQISLHVQIVLCPGINDGSELERTLDNLHANFKCVHSVGIVPVGLTRFRQRQCSLKPFLPGQMLEVIQQVKCWRDNHLPERESRWVYLADEFYLDSGLPIPPAEEYDDFPQIENGIGLARRFLSTVGTDISNLDSAKTQRRCLIATGMLAQSLLTSSLERLLVDNPGRIEIVPILNRFLGSSVTVAGLISGQDLLEQLRGRDGDLLLIPDVMLNCDGLFLDGITLPQVEEKLGKPVKVVPADGSGLLSRLTGHS